MARHTKTRGLLLALFIITVSGMNSQAGMVSLVFDDGLASVYRYAYPILKNNNQVATIGITYAFLMSGQKEFMDIEQILSLQQEGWEVASHGLTHSRSTEMPMLYGEEKIKNWAAWDKKLKIYHVNYKYKSVAGLFDNNRIMNEVSPFNQEEWLPGSYYLDRQNGQLFVKPFSPGNWWNKLNIRTTSCQREMEFSKRELETLGCKIETFITPYNDFSERLRDLSKNYYAHVASGKDKPNFRASFDPYHIWRFSVQTRDSVKSLEKIIERWAVKNDGWVVFCMHGIGDSFGWEPWDEGKLQELSNWLNRKGVTVVTIAQGASLYKKTP